MLTQAQYNANARALDRAISDAQRAYDDAALDAVTSESGDTSSLRNFQSDLEALKQQRSDLDAAWRAAAGRRVVEADEQGARQRDEALSKASAILDDAPKLALAAQQASTHFWEIVAELRKVRQAAGRMIRPHLLRHARELFDITEIVDENDIAKLLDEKAKPFDFADLTRKRVEKVRSRLVAHIASRRRTPEEIEADKSELIEAAITTEAV